MNQCLVIGSTVCDVIVNVDRLPVSQGDVHIKQQLMTVGGCAYNVASVLHHLNVPYTFISPVGTGIYADYIKQQLAISKVKTDIRVEGLNGCCYCFVEENGERTFMSHHGVEYSFKQEWLAGLDVTQYAYVYICGLEVEEADGEELVAALKDVDGQIIFCPGPRGTMIDQQLMNRVYQLSPVVHLNENEIKELTDEQQLLAAVKQMYAWTNNKVVVTLGERGAVLYDGELTAVDGYAAEVVDTIGAGDSHAAAVMAALSHACSLQEALDFANLLSSKVVGVNGVHLSEEQFRALEKKLHTHRYK